MRFLTGGFRLVGFFSRVSHSGVFSVVFLSVVFLSLEFLSLGVLLVMFLSLRFF